MTAMFIRSEPVLFNEMLRVRVGLIIKVMVWPARLPPSQVRVRA